MDLLLAEWYDETERARFLEGLAAIDGSSGVAGGLVSLAAPAQVALLQALDASATAPSTEGTALAPGSAGHTYGTLKRLTLYGYFTSQPVMTTVLKTTIWPGRYDGCVPA